jgi:hypothetical protein
MTVPSEVGVRKWSAIPSRDYLVQPMRDRVQLVPERRRAYASKVIAAKAWPSMRCTGLTLAPVATARLVAVCRRSCGAMQASPTDSAAGSKIRGRKLGLRSGPPFGAVNTSSS